MIAIFFWQNDHVYVSYVLSTEFPARNGKEVVTFICHWNGKHLKIKNSFLLCNIDMVTWEFFCSEPRLVLSGEHKGHIQCSLHVFVAVFWILTKNRPKCGYMGREHFCWNGLERWNPNFLCLPCRKKPQHISDEQRPGCLCFSWETSFKKNKTTHEILWAAWAAMCNVQFKKPEGHISIL